MIKPKCEIPGRATKPTEQAKHTPGSVKLAEEIVSSIWFNVQGRLDIVDNIATMIDVHVTAQQAEIARFKEAATASLVYDEAILSCANDPNKMSSFCTAAGDSLDKLYFDFVDKARTALTASGESTESEGNDEQ